MYIRVLLLEFSEGCTQASTDMMISNLVNLKSKLFGVASVSFGTNSPNQTVYSHTLIYKFDSKASLQAYIPKETHLVNSHDVFPNGKLMPVVAQSVAVDLLAQVDGADDPDDIDTQSLVDAAAEQFNALRAMAERQIEALHAQVAEMQQQHHEETQTLREQQQQQQQQIDALQEQVNEWKRRAEEAEAKLSENNNAKVETKITTSSNSSSSSSSSSSNSSRSTSERINERRQRRDVARNKKEVRVLHEVAQRVSRPSLVRQSAKPEEDPFEIDADDDDPFADSDDTEEEAEKKAAIKKKKKKKKSARIEDSGSRKRCGQCYARIKDVSVGCLSCKNGESSSETTSTSDEDEEEKKEEVTPKRKQRSSDSKVSPRRTASASSITRSRSKTATRLTSGRVFPSRNSPGSRSRAASVTRARSGSVSSSSRSIRIACSECSAQIRAAAKNCPSCGAQRSPEPPIPSRTRRRTEDASTARQPKLSSGKQTKRKICEDCGVSLRATAEICKKCGSPQ